MPASVSAPRPVPFACVATPSLAAAVAVVVVGVVGVVGVALVVVAASAAVLGTSFSDAGSTVAL